MGAFSVEKLDQCLLRHIFLLGAGFDFTSRVRGDSFDKEQNLSVALGVDRVMDAIRTVDFGDDDVHGLVGVFRGTNDESGF